LIFLFPYFGHTLPSCTEKGSKWQSELNLGVFNFWPVFGNQSYWGTFDPIFSDTGYTGLGIRNSQFCGEKNRPYYSLLAGRSSFRWAEVGGKREKSLFWGWWFSGIWFWDVAGSVIGVRRYPPTLSPKDNSFGISLDPIRCKKWRIPAHVLEIHT
jgi:hypothetical protein